MIYSDLKEAITEKGVKALFTIGLPSTFGIGVQSYEAKKEKPKF